MVKERKFSGEEPILISVFLTILVEEAVTLEISEGQAMVLLPHLLTGSVADPYWAAANGSNSDNVSGIFHWPEVVSHLLRTYGAEQAITEALEEFNKVHQTENDNRTAYAARLNKAAYLCWNVHDEDDTIYFYVNGLLLALKTIVQRFRNAKKRIKLSM